MSAASPAADAPAPPIGKAQLAAELSWSRPKLDRRLESDGAFPVVSRGDQSGGWKFDLAQVQAHLGIGSPAKSKKKSAPAAAPVLDQAQLRDTVKPPTPVATPASPVGARRSAHHSGEATARQRKDAADAALRENKLRQENGELVDRSEMRQVLAGIFISLGSDLDGLPEQIAKVLDLPDSAPVIRDLIDKARTEMVARAAPLLADD